MFSIIICYRYGPEDVLIEKVKRFRREMKKNDELIIVYDVEDNPQKLFSETEKKSISPLIDTIKRMYAVKVLVHPVKGVSSSRNEAARIAKGQYLLFNDPDQLQDKDYLKNIKKTIQSNIKINTIYGPTHSSESSATLSEYFRNGLTNYCSLKTAAKTNAVHTKENHFFISAGNMAISKDLFLKLGGFDPAFDGASAEDVHFQFKLFNAGEKIYFSNKLSTIHYHPINFIQFLRKCWAEGKGLARLYQSFPNIKTGPIMQKSFLPTLIFILTLFLGIFFPVFGILLVILLFLYCGILFTKSIQKKPPLKFILVGSIFSTFRTIINSLGFTYYMIGGM